MSLLKYEIYGIILITISVIALSRQAAVGHFLYYITSFILGKMYFVLPLAGAYIGLMTMLRQRWAQGWNSRWSGLVMLVCTLTLWSVLIYVPADQLISLPARQAAGGYIGAVQMWLFMMLFGVIGTKLIAGVMLVISLMLITQLSVVDLLERIRMYGAKAGTAVQSQWNASREALAEQRRERELAAEEAELDVYDETEEEYEEDEGHSAKRKGLFTWGRKPTPESEPVETDESVYGNVPDHLKETIKAYTTAERRDKTATASPIKEARQATSVQDEEDLWDNVQTEPELESASPELEKPLIIRDFFEQIRSERSGDQPEDHGTESLSSSSEFNPDYSLDHSAALPDSAALSADMGAASFPNSRVASGTDLNDQGTAEGLMAEAKEQTENGTVENRDSEAQEVIPVPAPPPPKPYKLPPFQLLAMPKNIASASDQNDYMVIARKLETTLESFGVRAKVLEVVRGPAVTRYEIQPDVGVKVSRIVGLTDDIALALAAKDIRMEAPIPGKSAIGIEVPNSEVSMVTMREVMETQIFKESEAKLSIAFGRDIAGQTIVGNLAKMPHLLVAGATGSGKSVCINGIITSILYKAKPDEVKFLMVDPKMVELNIYNGIPHLLAPVVTDPRRASLALKKIVVEMEKRYDLFSKSGTRNMEGYNNLMKDNPDAILPYIVVIVDELADLMMVAAGDVEDAIARLAQMARAAGIHLIIATQRPSVDVITGVIKANIPSRIAFGVSSQIDSRTILDMGGAEKLLGRGDMLFMPVGSSKPVRVQGAFMSDQEVETIVEYCRSQGEAQYNDDIVPEIDDTAAAMDEQKDELYDQAMQIVIEAKQASVSLLQRRMRVGYTRAARLIDSLEAHGVVGPYEGSKPREVLISPEQYHQINTGS
ncbi:cell division protein FtsK [Paenibacillus bovis]|uniref:Cell division protein FtsK n=1 Tax=Paenibacillus bovis TaxID=1616788 RepID=A0A172ZM98_9BACL|nr:DNA translocase FtsK [Paenibacillus bovis]ANF98766.1 cell division protein FtsK [Paenibacillus bovis]